MVALCGPKATALVPMWCATTPEKMGGRKRGSFTPAMINSVTANPL